MTIADPEPGADLVKNGVLDMTVVAPTGRADVGDRINYTLTATNAGNATLTGVTVSDPKLGALVCTPPQPATLAPGRADRLHRQLHADPGRPRRRPVHNTATADSDQTRAGDDAETVPLPQAPALTLVKEGTLDMTVVRAGQPRRRRRQGQLHADRDERRQRDADRRDDQRPEARRRSSARRRSRRRWRPAQQLVCTGSYTLTQADLNSGQVAQHRDADSDQTPPIDTPKTVPLPQAPALTLVKQGTLDMTVVAPTDRADAGDRINYTLTATNAGNVTLTGVTVERPEARDARVHAAAAGDAAPGRAASSAPAATR